VASWKLALDRKESDVLVLAIHQVPSLTRQRYEQVVERLTGGKARLESTADIPRGGLLVHAAAETDEGFVIFDVFESQEAFDDLMEIIGPDCPGGGDRGTTNAIPDPYVHLLNDGLCERHAGHRCPS
jgi:hypothetical protein